MSLDLALESFKNALQARFGADIEAVLLYGSRVRGDWNTDSDADVLVVTRAESLRAVRQVSAEIVSRLVCDDAPYISVFVMDSEQWQWKTPFTDNVRKDAVAL